MANIRLKCLKKYFFAYPKKVALKISQLGTFKKRYLKTSKHKSLKIKKNDRYFSYVNFDKYLTIAGTT
jgi:hypothetical protein